MKSLLQSVIDKLLGNVKKQKLCHANMTFPAPRDDLLFHTTSQRPPTAKYINRLLFEPMLGTDRTGIER